MSDDVQRQIEDQTHDVDTWESVGDLVRQGISLSDAVRRVASESASRERSRTGRPITREIRGMVVELIAAGLTVGDACHMAGISTAGWYHALQREPGLRARHDVAMERSIEAVEERLRGIALVGEMDRMATVRAAEVLLRGRSGRYRDQPRASAKVERREDGTGIVSVSVGTPLPE